MLTALCFSLAIHTKVQIAIIFVISLIIFSFIAKDKKPFKVLIYTIFFTALFIAIRTIPVLFSDSVYIVSLVKWYGGISSTFVQPDIMKILARLRLFDRFLSIVLLFTILVFLIKYLRTELEKFVYIFTSAAFFWWIFIFQLSTYRHLFIAIIPLCFLLSIMIERYFYFNHVKEKWNTGFFKYTAKAVLLLAIIYGFSINIFYAYVGYNDGVQFDLDGNKPASFLSVSHDDCQKNFYKEIKNYIKPSDTLYLGSYVTKFYLPNPVYDYRVLRNNIYEAPSEKLVLIGRDMFPISLNDGYAAIDTLKVKRELVLKKGSFELYKVNSIK